MPNNRWYFLLLGLFFSISDFSYTQSKNDERMFYGIGAGLGVSFINASSVVDYLNTNYSIHSKIDDFGAAAEFFGSASFQVSESWGGKFEYAYLLRSYNIPAAPMPDYTLSYYVHMPILLIHHYLIGDGYLFKFGGGFGYHFAQFSRDLNVSNTRYSSFGLGLKLEAEGHTAFDEHLFGTIGLDVRGNFMSDFEDTSEKKLYNAATGKNVTMSFFSIGLKFGLAYYF